MTKADLVISEVKIDDAIYNLRHIKNDIGDLGGEARAAQERLVIPALSAGQHLARAITNLETTKQYIEEIKNALPG